MSENKDFRIEKMVISQDIRGDQTVPRKRRLNAVIFLMMTQFRWIFTNPSLQKKTIS